MTIHDCVKKARAQREEEGKQCLLDGDVHGNSHSSECPCLKLAQKIFKNSN